MDQRFYEIIEQSSAALPCIHETEIEPCMLEDPIKHLCKIEGFDVLEYGTIENAYHEARRLTGSYKISNPMVGPITQMANTFSTTFAAVILGLNKRINIKATDSQIRAREITCDEATKTRIRLTTCAYVQSVLPADAIFVAFQEMEGFPGTRPNSWSEARWNNAVKDLQDHDTSAHGYVRKFAWNVKNELMSAEKTTAPRLISNEGDLSQVINSIVFKTCEFIDSHALSCFNIKHKNFNERADMIEAASINLDKIARSNLFRELGTLFLEGDGSKWDASCGKFIQEVIESVVYKHVAGLLFPIIMELPKEQLDQALKRRVEMRPPKMLYKSRKDISFGWAGLVCPIKLDETMRSTGDSGTSYLNRLVNMILWLNALASDPAGAMRNAARAAESASPINGVTFTYKCRFTGLKRNMCMFFEGDDSLLGLHRSVQKHETGIAAFWRSVGFNMKLVWRTDGFLEFCGYHYGIKDGVLTGAMVPDILRCFTSSSCSTSQMGSKTTDLRDQVALASNFARAIAFAQTFQPLGEEYRQRALFYARTTNKTKISDGKLLRELSFKAFGTGDRDITSSTFQVLDDIYQDAFANSRYIGREDVYCELVEQSTGMSVDALLSRGALHGPGFTHETYPSTALAAGFVGR